MRTNRVLVLGGHGYYGARVVNGLRAHGYDVTCGSRSAGARGGVSVDLSSSATFDIFRGFDAIVNCSDSVNAPPDEAVRHVLRAGGVWFEMGADAPTTERLQQLAIPDEAQGTVILGVGIFPGFSTLLARAVAEEVPRCERIDLVIRFSPLSGAGDGNCALMAESLFLPAARYHQGVLVQARSAAGDTARFNLRGQVAAAVSFSLPDLSLIRRATNAPHVATWFSFIPSWLRFNFRMLAWGARVLRRFKPTVVRALTWQLRVLRARLLRNTSSTVELLAIANRGDAGEQARTLFFHDGQEGTAQGVVAAVHAWLADPEPRPGVFGLAECFALADTTSLTLVRADVSRLAPRTQEA